MHFGGLPDNVLSYMLVLSRKVGERILIGENICVTIVRVAAGGVRVGIEAPSDMVVVREELKQDSPRSGVPVQAKPR